MNRIFPFNAIPLPYSFDALEPVISEETMYYHYEKLYKNYINRLNRAIESTPEYRNLTLEEIIIKAHHIPKDSEIGRAAGGVYNHEMYFESLSSDKSEMNSRNCKSLWDAIDADYSSRESFYEDIAEAANGVFGSGYAWVAADEKGKIFVAKYANQDTPLTQNAVPILPVDVWEHAYYLDYRHVRAEYVEKIFNIIDWSMVEERYCNNK